MSANTGCMDEEKGFHLPNIQPCHSDLSKPIPKLLQPKNYSRSL